MDEVMKPAAWIELAHKNAEQKKTIKRLKKAVRKGIKLEKYLDLLDVENLTMQTNDREWRKIIKEMQQELEEE